MGGGKRIGEGVLLSWLCSRPLDMCRITRTEGQYNEVSRVLSTMPKAGNGLLFSACYFLRVFYRSDLLSLVNCMSIIAI